MSELVEAEVIEEEKTEEVIEPQEETTEEETTEEETARQAKEDVVEYKRFKEVYGALKRTERELERIRSSASEPKTVSPAMDTKPKEDDYQDYADYEEAVLDWKLDQREAARNAKRQENDAKAQKEEYFKKIDEKVSDAVAKDPKFFEKGYIPEKFADLLSDSDHFAEFAYYFADNMGEVQRLLEMNPTKAAMEIGRIEAKFKLPKPKTNTNAPSPTKPLGGSTVVSKDPKDMDFDEYEAWRKSGGGT